MDFEVRYWLRAKPQAREAHSYNKRDDKIVTRFVPQLNGEDVCIKFRPTEFATKAQAEAEARRFQDAIRRNHRDA